MGTEPPVQPPQPPTPGGQPIGPGGTTTAEWWKRLVAYLIDGVIVSIPSYIVMLIFGLGFAATTPELEIDPDTGQLVGSGGGFFAMIASFLVVLLVIFLLGIAYFVYLHGSRGQTVGKMAMGIKLVKEETGELLSYGEALIRWLVAAGLWALCYVPGIVDGLWPLWDAKDQALHDKVVKSLVIEA